MEVQWNVPGIGESEYFFTPESYTLYSVKPSFIEAFGSESAEKNSEQSNAEENEPREESDQTVRQKINKPVQHLIHPELGKDELSQVQHPAITTPKWKQALLGLKVPFPHASSMTKQEQKTYIELCDHFAQYPARSEQDFRLLGQLKELQMKVSVEQEEYMTYLEAVARRFITNYNTVHPVVEKFVEEYLQKRRKVVCHYPRCYILHDTVPMCVGKAQVDIALTHLKTLLEMGKVYKLILPHLNDASGNAVKVPVDYDKVSKRYPQHNCQPENEQEKGNSKVPFSKDPVLNRLLDKYEADVAMTFGAFQCLIDNNPPNFNRQWEMAVTVKEYSVPGGKERRKVVLIDSPFVPKTLTPQEKNLIYHKYALKTLVIHPNHMGSFNLESKILNENEIEKQNKNVFDDNVFSDANDDLSSLETFGTDAHHSLNKFQTASDATSSDDESAESSASESAVPLTPSAAEDLMNEAPPSPIFGLDGLVDEKPDEAPKDKKLKLDTESTSRQRPCTRSFMSPRKSGEVKIESNNDTPALRRSTRIASRSRRTEYDFMGSDSDGDLVIDFSLSEETVESRLGRTPCRPKNVAENLTSVDGEPTASCNTALSAQLDEPNANIDASSVLVANDDKVEKSTPCQTEEEVKSSESCESLQRQVGNEGSGAVSDGNRKQDLIGQDVVQTAACSQLQTDQERGSQCTAVLAKTEALPLDELAPVVIEVKRKRGVPPKVRRSGDEVEKPSKETGQNSSSRKSDSNEMVQKLQTGVSSNCASESKVKPTVLELASAESTPAAPSNCLLPLPDPPVPSCSTLKTTEEFQESRATPSFLDQILSDQSKMFHRTLQKPSGVGEKVPGQTSLPRAVSSSLSASSIASQVKPAAVGNSSASNARIGKVQISPAVVEEMCEDPKEHTAPSVGNVAYHLWGFGGLKLLIRHHQHAVYKPYHHKPPYFVHIAPKLEYQAEHGVERVTPSELIQGWAALQLKQRARLVRAHINAFSSEIFLIENLDQNQITKGSYPSAYLMSMHLLLERLTKLVVGNYLIGHVPGSQHIQIKKATQAERGVYDLHLAYQQTETVLNQQTSSCWIPIDPSFRLRYHNKFFRIPCTFEPKDSAMVNTIPTLSFRKNTKNRGRKK